MTAMLKRKHDDLEDDASHTSTSSSSSSFSSLSTLSDWESDEKSSEGGLIPSMALNMNSFPTSILKKNKRQKRNNVNFDRVTVFYFPRCQGFTSVPSCGGCSLGMAKEHGFVQEFTMSEFCEQQKIVRIEKIKDKMKEEKLKAMKLKMIKNDTNPLEKFNQLTVEDISVDDIDFSNIDPNNGFFLQPYTTKKRCALLKSMGIKKIDTEEKYQLQSIRLSRGKCGCDCQPYCDPETCSCNLAGIKCQMDYTSFPCGCTSDSCGNTEGRTEFNQSRVQMHVLHTVMKLQLEENKQNSDGNPESELPFRDHLPHPVHKASYEERTISLMSVFKLATLETISENSCSSNTTDSSVSTTQNEDLEELFETNPKSQSDIDDNDDDNLIQILHFSDLDVEEDNNSIDHCQDNLSLFHPSDFFSMDVENQCVTNPVEEISFDSSFGYLANIGQCFDENANQGPREVLEISSGQSEEGASFSPSSFEELDSKSYMDLNFSSNSLDFFHPFSDYNLEPQNNSLREYENMDNFTVSQLPNLSTLAQPADQNNCFLESLIELSESISETPAPFSDNQLLEDAIILSLTETMKI